MTLPSLVNMKKFTVLCSLLFGFAMTSLLAEEAPVTPAAPGAATPPANTSGQSTASTAKKHHHKKHHKKKSDDTSGTSPAPTPPKS